MNLILQPLEITPSWPQLQHGPATQHHPSPHRAAAQTGACAPTSPMLFPESESHFKLRFSFSPSPKAWPSRGDSIGMDAPFSTAKAQEQIRGKSTGGARPKPTSHGWKSPGRRGTITYKYVNYSIAVCKRERMANIPSPRENAMVRSTRMCRREIDESGSLWHWLWSLAGWMTEEKLMRLLTTCSCQYLQLHSFWPNHSLCKFPRILRHFKHMSNSQIVKSFCSLNLREILCKMDQTIFQAWRWRARWTPATHEIEL